MAQEIEKKYLIPVIPRHIQEEIDKIEGDMIDQGYLAIEPTGTEVRLRSTGTVFTETVKAGSGLVRGEWEAQIDRRTFLELWPATLGRRIQKTRYGLMIPTPYNPQRIDLDVYDGKLVGLVVAEIEFANLEVAEKFTPPDWFGLDVTSDKAYKNQSLAVNGLPASFREYISSLG